MKATLGMRSWLSSIRRLALLTTSTAVLSCGENAPQPADRADTIARVDSLAVAGDSLPVAGDTQPAAIDAPLPTPAPVHTKCPNPAGATDRMICTDRMGPILRTTSRSQLARLLPGAALVDTAVHVGEGQFQPGTIINRGKSDSISVVWNDASRTRITGFNGLGTAWHTPDGLRVGSSLTEMERVLGPFAVLGFGWDYGGTAMLADTPLENSGIFFRMQPRSAAARQTAAYQRVRGERQYATSSADVRALDLVVRAIDVQWR